MRFYLSGVPVDILAEDHMGVVTEEEYAALPESKKLQGLYVVPEVGADLEGSCDIYSTEERIVGRWVDGKPIYRLCIFYQKTTSESRMIIESPNFDPASVDQLIVSGGSCSISDGTKMAIGSQYLIAFIYSGKLTLDQKYSSSKVLTYTGHMILEYTKLSDEAIL